ncbi:transporter substrate-binding domain-containing protein [Niveibacterium sp. 24ML]|uniref:substrate-binding periplasmic protein n=1 Tax=Niveibacterium sp. 24ML TaxID=2985512 RepID=UPI00226DA08B|nr:transporter substrate-binding domain-containing protein [Niveibacterium sp. 24ML]MCX9155401.1 transporter substrate-binding domain-containing protein [Niveibacterium sp. 24ML]
MITLRIQLFALGWLAIGLPAGAAPDTLTIHYNTRVPYAYVENGVMKGIMAEPVARALRKAKIPYTWAQTPFSRAMAMVKANNGKDCMISMFKKPGREHFGRFSAPVYRDSAQILLVRHADEAQFKHFASLASAMTEGGFRLLVKQTYSYGPGYDTLLDAREGPTDRVHEENEQMLRMLAESMTDAMIIAPEEASALIRHRGLKPEQFAYIRYPDTPEGELRHIWCSLNVPQSMIDQFNRALPPGAL